MQAGDAEALATSAGRMLKRRIELLKAVKKLERLQALFDKARAVKRADHWDGAQAAAVEVDRRLAQAAAEANQAKAALHRQAEARAAKKAVDRRKEQHLEPRQALLAEEGKTPKRRGVACEAIIVGRGLLLLASLFCRGQPPILSPTSSPTQAPHLDPTPASTQAVKSSFFTGTLQSLSAT